MTTQFIFSSKEQFQKFQSTFRVYARLKNVTSMEHILYNFIRDKDLKRGFTPIKNERKLNADYYRKEWRAFETALHDLGNSIHGRVGRKDWYEKYGSKVPGVQLPICMKYKDVISEEMWDAIYAKLKEVSK